MPTFIVTEIVCSSFAVHRDKMPRFNGAGHNVFRELLFVCFELEFLGAIVLGGSWRTAFAHGISSVARDR